VLFVIPCGNYLPGGIVRVLQFLPFLDRLGIGHTVLNYFSPNVDRFDAFVRAGGSPRAVRPALLAGAAAARKAYMWWTRVRILWLAPRADLVYLFGVLPPVWYTRALMRRNAHTVLDLDDAIFLDNPGRGKSVMTLMWQVIAGSHSIFDYAKPLNPRVVLVPSSVSLDRHDAVDSPRTDPTRSVIRIGWLGSSSTVKYLRHLVEPLRQLAAEGHEIEFMVAGTGSQAGCLPAFPGITVTVTPSYSDQDIPSLVSRYDIGVMPLDDGPWERAKCAMKAVIYMAAGKPAICSRVGENLYVINDGVNGCLVESEQDWITTLRALIVDPQLRAEMGRRGRKTVEERYSAEVCFALLYEHVFSRVGSNAVSAGTAN
jgi:glycosyltransferase involved in cell wall biosynthesis